MRVSSFTEPGDEDLGAAALEFIDTVDTMILGANTYAMSKDYWPTSDDQGEYGEKLNNLTKFVASSSLKDAPWGKFPAATAHPVASVRELKEQDGKDIWLWGSLKLMQSMFEAGVVDEVHTSESAPPPGARECACLSTGMTCSSLRPSRSKMAWLCCDTR
ncbi:dihydrofolate reductase family protein [Parapedobacter tibetensis]|uniref:dihydrofolate reductase family protein n=1 Tax=Parapedobacter tibetensis TaxID=2972951 RepID=UPI00214D3C29|nr:dihydrofolate reductase family protein [Parapedobacter tibetensis]